MKMICIWLILNISTIFIAKSQTNFLYWNEYTSFNPAYNGLMYKIHGTFDYSSNSPFNSDFPYKISNEFDCKVNRIHGGLGLTSYNEKNGPIKSNTAMLHYSFHIKLDDDKLIGIGISPKFIRTSVRQSSLMSGDDQPMDEIIDNGDIINNNIGVNFGVGYISNKIESGISINYENYVNYLNGILVGRNETYAFFRYNYKIGNQFNVTPGLLWCNVNKHFDNLHYYLDISLIVTYRNRFWIGGLHREMSNYSYDNDDIGIAIGYDIAGKVRIGIQKYLYFGEFGKYSYDEFTVSVMIK